MGLEDASLKADWQIELCSADDRQLLSDLLERTMYIEEPVMSTLDVSSMDVVKNHTAYVDIVLEGHSFKAVTPAGRIVGVVLNKSCPYQIEEYEPIPKVIDFLYYIEKAMKLDCTGLLDIYMLAVDPDFRRQEVAKVLVQKTEAHAMAKGFRGMKATAFSVYSANLARSLGFRTHYSIAYKDYKDENREIVFNTPNPHTHLNVMVKEFKKLMIDNLRDENSVQYLSCNCGSLLGHVLMARL